MTFAERELIPFVMRNLLFKKPVAKFDSGLSHNHINLITNLRIQAAGHAPPAF